VPQGVRNLILPVLLLAGRDDEAAALLDRYADDRVAVRLHGHALVTFRREGDGAAARDRLRAALRANRAQFPRHQAQIGIDLVRAPEALDVVERRRPGSGRARIGRWNSPHSPWAPASRAAGAARGPARWTASGSAPGYRGR